MGTDYDPPTRYEMESELPGMSAETLKLLEREMGFSFGQIMMPLGGEMK